MPQTILIVDDDELLRRSVSFHLQKAGYQVQSVGTAEGGIALARGERPHLVLLDINLPGIDGLEALRSFRDELHLPVILVTARRREFDEVLGLELGANDYVTKPFDKDVLVARVRAALRNAQPNSPRITEKEDAIHVGDLTVEPGAHRVTVSGRVVDLSPREYRLLLVLAQEAGRVVGNDDLLDRVWGAGFEGQMQVVYVHVRWLREKIEENPQKPRRLLTVRGVGYKLVAPEV